MEESLKISQQKNKQLQDEISTIQNEKLEIQNETSALLEKVKNDNSHKDNLIDKRLVGNFLVNYFDLTENSDNRIQLLQTLSSILCFTDEDNIKIG